jgi:uncharacterized tellurite resistance protein B-like protein
MKNNDFKSFLFRTAVVAMACDGDIAESEIKLLKDLVNKEINFLGFEYENMLESNIQEIKLNGKSSINNFLEDINNFQFNERQKLKIIEICLAIINADNNLEVSELTFLHLLIKKLGIDLESLIVEFPQSIDLIISSESHDSQSEFTDEIIFND